MSLVPWMYFQCCSCTLLNFAEVPISVMASTQVVKILLVIVNTFQSDDERIRSWKFWEISTQVLVTDTASTQVVKKVLIVAHTFQSDEKRKIILSKIWEISHPNQTTLYLHSTVWLPALASSVYVDVVIEYMTRS